MPANEPYQCSRGPSPIAFCRPRDANPEEVLRCAGRATRCTEATQEDRRLYASEAQLSHSGSWPQPLRS